MRGIAVLPILSVPLAASAREVEISVGSVVHLARSSSADAVSSDDVIGMGDVGLAVELGPVPFFDAAYAELHVWGGGTGAEDFQQIGADLHLLGGQLGLKGMRRLWPRVRGFARLDAGLVRGALTLDGGDHRLASEDVALLGYVGAGIDLLALERGELAFGLRLEAGYTAARPLAFSASPDHPDDDLARIETRAASLGELDASGWSWRVGFVGRF